MSPNNVWKGYLKTWELEPPAARVNAPPWVMAYSHKTQSFMKNRGQQKCLNKGLP